MEVKRQEGSPPAIDHKWKQLRVHSYQGYGKFPEPWYESLLLSMPLKYLV